MRGTPGERLGSIFEEACTAMDASLLTSRAVPALPAGTRLLALGKVANAMVRGAREQRPDLKPLACISPEGGDEPWSLQGAHPLPDERSFAAGAALLGRARQADGAPLALLLSGGGSSLAAAPAPGLTAADKIAATRLLLRSGLDIVQMNVVRKRLSALKGGRLALAAPRSPWWVLALSDVVGDDLGSIASGPCSEDLAPAGEAQRLCRRARIWENLPRRLRARLPELDRPVGLADVRVDARVLASASSLATAAARAAPWPATVLDPVADPIERCAQRYSDWAREHRGRGPQLLVAAGEPVLRVSGGGRGGRAQHLALLMARELAGLEATFLAAGTDGRDGETDHAGAIVDGRTAERAGERLAHAIARFDSAPLHAVLGTALPRRAPRTHLGELHLLLVE